MIWDDVRMEKKLISECISKDVSNVIFDTHFELLIEKLQDCIDQFSEYKSLYFINNSYYDDLQFDLYGDRYETDEEYEKRLKKEKLRKMTPDQRKEAKEIEQLKKLI